MIATAGPLILLAILIIGGLWVSYGSRGTTGGDSQTSTVTWKTVYDQSGTATGYWNSPMLDLDAGIYRATLKLTSSQDMANPPTLSLVVINGSSSEHETLSIIITIEYANLTVSTAKTSNNTFTLVDSCYIRAYLDGYKGEFRIVIDLQVITKV